MRLRGVRRSRNIEDRRRSGGGGKAGIGGVGLLVVLAIGYFAGIDVTPLLQQVPQQSAAPRARHQHAVGVGEDVEEGQARQLHGPSMAAD